MVASTSVPEPRRDSTMSVPDECDPLTHADEPEARVGDVAAHPPTVVTVRTVMFPSASITETFAIPPVQ